MVLSMLDFINPVIITKKLVNKFKYNKSTRRLTEEEMIMVKQNVEAYKDPSVRQNVLNWQYQPFLSNQEVAVFKQRTNVNIIYKGTSNKENVFTDMKLISNIADRTFRVALKEFENIKKTFPSYIIKVSGHSLGGSKALYISKEKLVRAVVFNPFTPNTYGKMNTIVRNNPLINVNVNRDDMLSEKMIIINPPGLNVFVIKGNRSLLINHSIDTYLDQNNFLF